MLMETNIKIVFDICTRKKSGEETSLILYERVGECVVLVKIVGKDGVREEDGHGEEGCHEGLEEEHHELEDEEGFEAAARLLPTEAALEVSVEAAQRAHDLLHAVHVFGEDATLERLRRCLFLRLKNQRERLITLMQAAFNGTP